MFDDDDDDDNSTNYSNWTDTTFYRTYSCFSCNSVEFCLISAFFRFSSISLIFYSINCIVYPPISPISLLAGLAVIVFQHSYYTRYNITYLQYSLEWIMRV